MNTLSKSERLKSKTLMDRAFSEGIRTKSFPFLIRAIEAPLAEEVPFQAAFSVGKKRFRRAVDRNRIKRLMREVWRAEKASLAKNWKVGDKQWAVVFIFVGKELPAHSDCQFHLRRAIQRLVDSLEA